MRLAKALSQTVDVSFYLSGTGGAALAVPARSGYVVGIRKALVDITPCRRIWPDLTSTFFKVQAHDGDDDENKT